MTSFKLDTRVSVRFNVLTRDFIAYMSLNYTERISADCLSSHDDVKCDVYISVYTSKYVAMLTCLNDIISMRGGKHCRV